MGKKMFGAIKNIIMKLIMQNRYESAHKITTVHWHIYMYV